MAFLIGVKYEGNPLNRAILQFMDSEGHLKIVTDPFNHSSYWVTGDLSGNLNTNDSRIRRGGVQLVRMTNLLWKEPKLMRKITVRTPLDVGGPNGLSNFTYDNYLNDLKYQEVYTSDTLMCPGFEYSDKYQLLTRQVHSRPLTNLLMQPIPNVPFITLDIEVKGSPDEEPDAELVKYPINMVSLVASDGKKYVYTTEPVDFVIEGCVVEHYDDEVQMLLDALGLRKDYPMLLTFYGTEFDLLYIHNRLLKLGVTRENIPIELKSLGMGVWGATMKHQVHLDLCALLKNLSIKNYVYGQKYKFDDLDTIGEALVGFGKLDYDWGDEANTPEQLAKYCLRDSEIVHGLLTVRDWELWKIIVTLCRIVKVSPEDLCVWGTSKWVQFMLLWAHKRAGLLMPSREQLRELTKNLQAASKSVTKGKKFKGAEVLEPKPGLHFNVVLLDFASLYTGIISYRNFSYETVKVKGILDCDHPAECSQVSSIPDTPYYVCQKVKGFIATQVGELREARVMDIKPLAKTSSLMKCVDQGAKVILNAEWGVFASEKFPLYYLPMAESITSTERYILNSLVDHIRAASLEPLFGDTDSVAIYDSPVIPDIIKWAKAELKADLEIDKTFVWLGLTARKKNYLGMPTKGDLLIKGLQGKKSSTPPLVARAFREVIDVVKPIRSRDDFDTFRVKERVKEVVQKHLNSLLRKEYPISDWVRHMSIKTEEYKGKLPQHAQALVDAGEAVKLGKVSHFVNTVTGAKAVKNASVEEIDTEKYFETYVSSLSQVSEALGLPFFEAAGLEEVVMVKL